MLRIVRSDEIAADARESYSQQTTTDATITTNWSTFVESMHHVCDRERYYANFYCYDSVVILQRVEQDACTAIRFDRVHSAARTIRCR